MATIDLSDDDLRKLRRLLAKVDSVSGPGVRNGPFGVTMSPPPQRPPRPGRNPRPVVLLKIIAAATGGGWYTARLWLPPDTDPNPESDLTEAALGTTDTNDVYFANLSEVGFDTHDLTDGGNTTQKLVTGLYRGVTSDGKPFYVSKAFWLKDCEEPA